MDFIDFHRIMREKRSSYRWTDAHQEQMRQPYQFVYIYSHLHSAKLGELPKHLFVAGHPFAIRTGLYSFEVYNMLCFSVLLLAVLACAGAGLNGLEDEASNSTTPAEDKEYVICIHTLQVKCSLAQSAM